MANPFMIQQADFGKAFEDFSRGQTQKVERDRMIGLRAQSDERNQRIFDLEKSIAADAGKAGFDPISDPRVQELSVLNSKSGKDIVSTAQGFSKQRKKSFFNDANEAFNVITDQNVPMSQRMGIVHEMATKRKAKIKRLGGDTNGTDLILQAIESGDLQGATNALQSAVSQGMQAGFLGGKTADKSSALIINSAELDQKRKNLREAKTPEQRKIVQQSIKDFEQLGNMNKQEIILQRKEAAIELAQEKANISIAKQKSLETELQDTRLKIEKARDEVKRKRLADIEKFTTNRKINTAAIEEARGAVLDVETLLKGDLFASAYGTRVANTPESLKTDNQIDARARLDRLSALLELAARGKLKGSGQISDSEQGTLKRSVTLLGNEEISDELARSELENVRKIFEKNGIEFNALLDFQNKNKPSGFEEANQQNNNLLQQSDNSLGQQVDPARARLEAARARKRARG